MSTEILYHNLQGLNTDRDIAAALDQLPYGAPRRALRQTMRPVARFWAGNVRDAEQALQATLKVAQAQFDERLRTAPPGDPFRVEHEADEAARAVTQPARAAFAAAIEEAVTQFRARLADAVEEAKRL